MRIEFLCGCTTGEIISRANLETMNSIVVDDEGMLTCLTHGARRKGWRSIPASSNHPGMKTSYYSMTPAEIEGRILFKDPFPPGRREGSVRVELDFSGEDKKDNRDPIEVCKELFGERFLKL
jgi:hypothetical protein